MAYKLKCEEKFMILENDFKSMQSQFKETVELLKVVFANKLKSDLTNKQLEN